MILKKTIIGALTGMLLLGGVGASQAADVPVTDPGPVGNFSWEGFNWETRFWNGAPHYNGAWSADNVSNPDANGHVTMKITNPTGNSPVAAEFQSTRRGFGYGTYSTTVEKNINSMQKEVVWGCLFTYDPDSPPGFNEIDLCEASAWGGGAAYGEAWPITQGHGYWFDASKGPGLGNNTVTFPLSSSPILTHKMVWEPGKVTFETFEGEGYAGTLLKRTVLQGANVPVPAKERVHFNLWVTGGGGGDPAHVQPESVKVRDFSFTPSSVVTPAPVASTIPLSATSVKYKAGYRTTVKWSGTTESTVSMYVNGVKKSVPNTGSFVSDVKRGSTTTYKLCDSQKCSTILSIKVSQ